MHCFIRKIVLWPKDDSLEPRVISFEPRRINLITGRSRTGKSSITAIIDYCLGSGKCAIPVGPIRTSVAWYGVLLDLGSIEMLVAREEPGDRIESSNYHVQERAKIELPRTLEKNSNREAFKLRMDTLAGLPRLPFDTDKTVPSGFQARPSFRDMAAFNFLPQHIVANPYTLFFKADTQEHREKLRTIFPLVLGAVEPDHLSAEHEMTDVERRLRRLEADMARRNRAVDIWRAEAAGLYARARELSLVPDHWAQPTSPDDYVRTLARIPDEVRRVLPPLQPGRTEEAVARLNDVRARERQVASKIGDLRRRLQQINSLRDGFSQFASEGARQSGRVAGVGWFSERLARRKCPLCGTEQNSAGEELVSLQRATADLQERLRVAGTVPSLLDSERVGLQKELRDAEEELRALRAARRELEAPKEDNGQALEEVYRFVGRLEEAVRNIGLVEPDSDQSVELERLRRRLAELRSTLDVPGRERRLRIAIGRVTEKIRHYAGQMQLERANEDAEIRIKDLALVFRDVQRRREDFLWEIGSGENWMGYHIAVALALHEYFLNQTWSPVPSFLVIDQPSQVYFPAGFDPSRRRFGAESHEVRATRRIFETLEEGLRRTHYCVQIIVTEHADESTLGGIPTVDVIENWHPDDTDYLIPRSWLQGR
ncbi:DUF3732 domain-containing protein [Sorangium sp. So ce381]|uniref:DUF3732 domain-containing protein n=1 Tax=Sorangium sp. So ce381 TaxID=3133307 RepID=UPI003F5B9320